MRRASSTMRHLPIPISDLPRTIIWPPSESAEGIYLMRMASVTLGSVQRLPPAAHVSLLSWEGSEDAAWGPALAPGAIWFGR
jgi:hypothetical protein